MADGISATEQISNTLHIIGNGFDLHHGIDSQYSQFKEFAWKHAGWKSYYLSVLEECYPMKNNTSGELVLWSDLEKALGNPDFKAAYLKATEDIEEEEGHEMRDQAIKADAPTYLLKDVFKTLHELFEKWIDSLNIDVEPDVSIPYFDRNALFMRNS